MSVDLALIFLNAQTIRNPDGLERFIEGLQASGFRVWDFKVGRSTEVSSQSDDCTIQVLQLARELHELKFNARRPTGTKRNLEFDFFVQIGWGEHLLQGADRTWVCLTCRSGPLLRYPEFDPTYHSRLMLDIGKKIYSTLLPAFAWIDFGHLAGHTWFDDLEKLRIPHIYWANYFGPAYLAGIGRVRVMRAPAWRLEPLDDGGLLYVLASSPDSTEDHVDVRSVKEHFGIDAIR